MKAMTARVQLVSTVGSETEVTVSVGAKQGIDKTWQARLLRAGSKDPLPGGEGRITTVDDTRTKIRFKGITTDIAQQNEQVELSPPGSQSPLPQPHRRKKP